MSTEVHGAMPYNAVILIATAMITSTVTSFDPVHLQLALRLKCVLAYFHHVVFIVRYMNTTILFIYVTNS
jgi:hypothetical protein